jgi:predicted Rossmann fold flavoprotein
MQTYDCAVIGGGAAGLLAAGAAGASGAKTLLIEKNDCLGRKLLLTGKGRCNVTNSADLAGFLANIPAGGKFLQSAFRQFSNWDLLELLRANGVETKEERGGRIFPAGGKAASVAGALQKYALSNGAARLKGAVSEIVIENGAVAGVRLKDGPAIAARAVIVATGGLSYPQTGSTGDGFRFARRAGHTVSEARPSLVPLTCADPWTGRLAGLSLKNAGARVLDGAGAVVYTDFGELLFTHFGLSGPMALSASAHLRGFSGKRYAFCIDLKPALSAQQLDRRLLRDFAENKNKDFVNALDALLPQKLIPLAVELSGIGARKKVHEITKAERRNFGRLLKDFRADVVGTRPIAEAIVTSGGVCLKEINPKTMESKLIRGLYFAGEVLDADAYTGGFNLQIAFSTGFAAGKSAGAPQPAALGALSD